MISAGAFSFSLIGGYILRYLWGRDESRAQAIVQVELPSFRAEFIWSE